MGKRLAQCMLHLHALQQMGAHLRLVKPKAPPPPLLDLVHGGVGLLDELVQCASVLWEQRQSDTALDGEAHAVQRKGAQHHFKQATRHLLGHLGIAAVQVHGELVSPNAAKHVALAQAGLKPGCDFLQHAITELMPQRIIDELEAVQIHEQDRKTGVRGPRSANGCLHTLRQEQSVGQPRQGVAVGQFVNSLLCCVLLGQITHETNALFKPPFAIAQSHPGQMHSAAALAFAG